VVFVVAAACALVTPVAPAYADAEMERLDCTGDIGWGALHDPHFTTTYGTISCTRTHYAVVGASPEPGFTSALEAEMWNWPTAPGVYDSSGNLSFWWNGVKWIVSLTHHTSVLGVMTLGQANPLEQDDRVGPVDGTPFPYHIRYGTMTDELVVCPKQACFRVLESGFSFTAEYVYDLPVAAGAEVGGL
jgi:hypothetical protein